jgi:hypothetical protein
MRSLYFKTVKDLVEYLNQGVEDILDTKIYLNAEEYDEPCPTLQQDFIHFFYGHDNDLYFHSYNVGVVLVERATPAHRGILPYLI